MAPPPHTLTELRTLPGGFQKQLQLEEHQGHVDGVAAQPLHAEEEGDGRLELRRQEQHLEVEEGLLVHREVGLAWGRDGARSEGVGPAPGRALCARGTRWADAGRTRRTALEPGPVP